ncbi:hypothetical protein GTP81_28140 [Rugamonas sp. FT107W]|uniref:Lipoprotein n=1 Tax=Duganella vulcania TaxID=2692166 RepID=A0A845HPR2_9BURK|nr:hypothetical protein [Duganella vulcania]MYN20617.1 hypothetical protein [Duganella vulcania]
MRKRCSTVLLSLISPVVLACEPEAALRLEAIRTLYADPDIARYVCVDDGACGIEEFARQIDVRTVSLSPAGAGGIQVEPVRKGAQYFSALFLRDQCRYKMVFAPDTTLSDVKLLKKQKNNFYVLRAVERDSAQAWKEYDFAYDPATRQYAEPAARCFSAAGGKNNVVKCE